MICDTYLTIWYDEAIQHNIAGVLKMALYSHVSVTIRYIFYDMIRIIRYDTIYNMLLKLAKDLRKKIWDPKGLKQDFEAFTIVTKEVFKYSHILYR